ncbi:hypothetical protein [Natrinema altunense]|uniref:DUF8173 domain-containing protein n=1 Tax=Natrinema altunense TaxID=222984 RepID=A0A482XWV8_9EURY|nr:hypothetical protein [Natrinema altunense]RZH68159.1 hypothetical protein ELS17_01430 [Natrinema altunense]
MRPPFASSRAVAMTPPSIANHESSVPLALHDLDDIETVIDAVAGSPWYVQSAIAGLLTLGIGGLLIVTVPAGTRRRTDRALEVPLTAFLYGCPLLSGVIGLSLLIAMTVTERTLVVLAVVTSLLVAVVVSVPGYLAIGRLVADDWLPALGVAVAVSAAVGAVPTLGTLAGFLISSFGIGTVVMGLVHGRDSAT